MRDVLRLVPLIGYYVEIEIDSREVTARGVADAVTSDARNGVRAMIVFADGDEVAIVDGDEVSIEVWSRNPNAE